MTSSAITASSEVGAPVQAPRPRGGRLRRRFNALSQYLGFAPAALLFGVFFAAPMVLIVAYSFWTQNGYVVEKHVDASRTTSRSSARRSTSTRSWSTLWMTAAATALTLAIAAPFAYWLARYVSRRWQRPLLFLVIIPFWVSYLLRVTAWTIMLGNEGALSRLLSLVGLSTPGWLLYDRPAVIFVLTYLYFPFAALTLYAALERFDWRQLHAAMDLGATNLQAMRLVMLPQIRSGVMTAVIFVFIPILGEYLTPELVGGVRGVMIGNLDRQLLPGGAVRAGIAPSRF